MEVFKVLKADRGAESESERVMAKVMRSNVPPEKALSSWASGNIFLRRKIYKNDYESIHCVITNQTKLIQSPENKGPPNLTGDP